jgi:CheY-like chemotaxis protein
MILLVASHPDSRQLLPRLISAKGYPVATLDCNDDLLPRLRFQPPALLIVDCDIPDSFNTLDLVRASPITTSVPVIMYSHSDTNLREKALAKGATAFIPKGSLDWADLLTEITRHLGPPPLAPQ